MKSRFFKAIILSFLFSFGYSCNDDTEPTLNGNILGTWHVVAIHNSSPTGSTLGPLDEEVIAIIFPSNGEFMGTTSVNSFGGRSSTEEQQLFIEELVTTKVADTNFGQAFYQAFSESMNVETGFSEFEIAKQNDDTLHLEHNGFKFLTLQKQ
ncbi:MAG: META domain-containing protein [Flavobacteriaceae bacterium]